MNEIILFMVLAFSVGGFMGYLLGQAQHSMQVMPLFRRVMREAKAVMEYSKFINLESECLKSKIVDLENNRQDPDGHSFVDAEQWFKNKELLTADAEARNS